MVDGDPGPEPLRVPGSRWVRAVVVLLVAVVVPSALVALVVVRSPAFSRLDEPAHADYLRRIEQREVPRVGDRMLEQTVEDVQCRTVQGRTNAPCGLDEYDPQMLGASGYQYEAQQPPLYYAVTAVLRQPARLGPADDFVTTARLTGAVWLSAGLLVFFVACRRLGCGWWPTVIVTLLLGVGPGILYQSATINNDAAAILTGGLALLMFANLRRRASGSAVLIWTVAAVLLVLVKPTGVLAVAAASLALLVDALVDRRSSWRQVGAFLAPTGAGLAVYGLWSVVRDARATVDYDVVLEALLSFKMVDELPLDDIGASYLRFLGSYAPGGLPISPPWVVAPATVLMICFTASATAALWHARGGEPAHRVASVALLTLLAASPAFTLLFYLDYSVEGGPTARYGLGLLPLLFAGGAATYRTRRGMAALVLLGALLIGPLLLVINWPTVRGG